ncbi:MAG: hypothetical protein ACE5K8_10265, partial [Candidatus Zixiibacteriota bacterium]
QVSFKYYPFSNMEVDLTSQYTYYSKTFNLSNLLYSGEITFIPTGENSSVNVYLSGKYDRTLYRDKFESFDNANIRLTAALEYVIKPWLRLRTGSKFTVTRYVNADSVDADHEKYDLFAGLNIVAFGSNSLDIESGWGTTNFSFVDDTVQPSIEFTPGSSKGSFNSFYISPRISRPLGSRTGISVTYTYRHFTGADHSVVAGYSTGYLSPWATIYEGSSVTLQLKSHLVPQMIVTTGIGYWDKTYLKTRDRVWGVIQGGSFWYEGWIYANEASPRKDYFTRLYLSLRRPISFGVGGLIEPTLTIGYSENRSSLDVYDYTSTTFTVELIYRMK